MLQSISTTNRQGPSTGAVNNNSNNNNSRGEGGSAGAAAANAPASAQFICTTFRPEMVLVADQCYGVTYDNKTSGIDVVEREEALNFVEESQAAGNVAAAAAAAVGV